MIEADAEERRCLLRYAAAQRPSHEMIIAAMNDADSRWRDYVITSAKSDMLSDAVIDITLLRCYAEHDVMLRRGLLRDIDDIDEGDTFYYYLRHIRDGDIDIATRVTDERLHY